MLIFFHQDRLISSLEQMADPLMPDINPLGKHAIQLPHSQGEIWLLCFHQDVVMIIEQAKGMTQPIVFFNNIAQYLKEYLPVDIIDKDTLQGIASGSDMIYCSREFYS
jgi:hypothetical protein